MAPEKPLEQAVCARCDRAIDLADHFEIRDLAGAGQAFLCRSEHIVAWVLRGAGWQFERPWEIDPERRAASGRLLLIRRRAGEELSREFENIDALKEWASAGGFWAEAE